MFAGVFEVVTPLHVGSGATRQISRVKGAEARGAVGLQNDAPEVAAIVRDCDGRPYIPGSTIKGAFRRVAEDNLSQALVAELFGSIKVAKDEEDPVTNSGHMGVLIFRGCRLESAANARAMPYADPDANPTFDDLGQRRALGPGVFVAARTSIDPERGTAATNRLFFQEVVAPGTKFTFTAQIRPIKAERGDGLAAEFVSLLDATRQHGIYIGKSTADGAGLIRFNPRPNSGFIAEELNATSGTFQKLAKWVPPKRSNQTTSHNTWPVTLQCSEPFLIVDSSWEPEPPTDQDRNSGPQLRGQKEGSDQALVLGSSVSGALRSRARWLQYRQLRRSMGSTSLPEIDCASKVVRSIADVPSLTPLEMLFGVTGYGALLQVRNLKVECNRTQNFTSVRLDRFSGAPIDNALFTSEAFVGTRITFALTLDTRRLNLLDAGQRQILVDLTDKLHRDLRTNGLELGHGTGKGFGWFAWTVE